MSDLMVMEAANVFIGEENPDKGKALQIQNLTLPNIEFVTVDHMGGGAVAELSIHMGVLKKMEPAFKLIGFDEDAYAAAGIGSNKSKMFTFRGGLRRKRDSRLYAAVATINGCLGKATPDQFDRSNAFGHDHMIVEVVRYRLVVSGRTWFDFDYWEQRREQFGIDEFAEMRSILGM
jgi:P2 family phage contractile tail tube protein